MNKLCITSFTATLVSLASLGANAQQVEITLLDPLDGILNGYCIDVAGGNRNIDISKGLQTHTCYSYRGSLGEDQAFETKKFTDHALYMPNYEVCATLSGLEAGAKVNLATCNDSPEQSIVLTQTGKLSPSSALNLCLTAGEETRFGRGGTSQHQIKTLTLEQCSEQRAAYQTWRTRTYDDDPS
ncbi:ricin-type beta-trefoil lectin domain protein [Marinomonas epiphytica]